METCRAFYSIGVPFLLRQKVSLNNEAALESFCSFLFAVSPSPSNRPRLLRDLHFSDDLAKKESSTILRVLSGATHLRSLDIFLPHPAPEFRNVLTGYTNLRELEINLESGETATEVLGWFEKIRSPIDTLTICFLPSPNRAVLPSISSLAGTLKSLTLHCAIIDTIDAKFEFPHVQQLCLSQSFRPSGYFPPSAAIIFRLFPNLELLTLPDNSRDGSPPINYENRVQEATDFGVHRKHLKRLEGCLTELSLGGYNCFVDELYLRINDCWEWDGDKASFLLSQARPSVFHLDFFDEFPSVDMIPIIEAVPSLGSFKELSISLQTVHPDDAVFADITRSLPEALRGVDTETLVLEFLWHIPLDDTESPFLMHEFDIEELFLQVHAVARKPRTIIIQPHYTRKTIFDVPVDFVESVRRKRLDEIAE
ncbi:hypothetical protein NLI96_g7326 [Meripilus lineatus]|uniref:F-box domain-containing protein n=1 Tax=Meripilus lineatus TaxID=2056292 RepID=A0AAD5YHB2_9APHY|nr:hypothetical protein NLI96_g7326 [Physisporinus lineatus]